MSIQRPTEPLEKKERKADDATTTSKIANRNLPATIQNAPLQPQVRRAK